MKNKKIFISLIIIILFLVAGFTFSVHASTKPIYWIVRSGQSLSMGAVGYCNSAGYPTCSSGATYGNLTIFFPGQIYPPADTQFRTLAGHIYQGASPALESSATSMCNQFAALSGRTCATSDYGWPGASFSQLKKGGTNFFDDSIGNGTAPANTGVIQAKALASAQGSAFYVPGVYFNQGESEMNGSQSASIYEGTSTTGLVGLQDDYQTSINSAIGQTGLIPLFIPQKSSWASWGAPRTTPTSTVGNADGVPIGQLDACLDHYSDGKIFCTGPDYATPYVGDGVHKAAQGYRTQGGIEGLVIDWVTRKHKGWRPFYPKSISISGSTADVQFWVPPTETESTGSLVLDTTNVAPLPDGNMGFETTSSTGAVLQSVALKGGTTDTVTLTFDKDPGTIEVRYAWTAPNGAMPSGQNNPSTSTTSLTIDGGTPKTLTVASSNLAYTSGTRVQVYETSNPTQYFTGTVNSYSSTTLVVDVAASSGSGTHSDWSVCTGCMYTGPTYGPRGNIANNGSTSGSWNGDSMRSYALTFRIPNISAASPYTWNPSNPTNLGTIPGVFGKLFPMPSAFLK